MSGVCGVCGSEGGRVGEYFVSVFFAYHSSLHRLHLVHREFGEEAMGCVMAMEEGCSGGVEGNECYAVTLRVLMLLLCCREPKSRGRYHM